MSTATIIPSQVRDILARYQLADGYDLVLDMDRSHGAWLHDSIRDEPFLDCFTCFASWPLGYNHPGLNEPAFEQELLRAAKCNPSNSDLYTAEMATFVETFAKHATPEGFDHHFWIAGGGLAVENAMKAAFDWKARALGRTNLRDNVNDLVIAHFEQAFHGRTGYTLSVTNTLPDKVGLFPKFSWPRFPAPACQFDHDGNVCNDVESLEELTMSELEAYHKQCASSGNHMAAILIEPMQAEGGDRHFRPEFFSRLREAANRMEALLIFDEVQTGFFGSGKPWMWQHNGIAPDIVAFGKKAQVCGIYANNRIDEIDDNVFQRSSRINSTWGGSLTDMVRSRRFIELIIEHDYCSNALARGEQILSGLRRIAADTGAFGNVRGVGTLLAVDFETPERRNEALAALFEARLMALPCGKRSMRFRTPLNLEEADADEVLNRTEQVSQSL